MVNSSHCMTGKPHRLSFTLPLIGTLATLLTVLAVLQYRWQGQISVAERQTMQTNLRNQARGLQEEFNKEIDRACSRFEISYADLRKQSWAELIERYDRWKAITPYPGLIKALFVASVDDNGHLSLARFNETAKRVEPAEWPAEFSDLRKRFEPRLPPAAAAGERREGAAGAEMERREEQPGLGAMIERGYVAEEVPAIVRLILDRERLEKQVFRRSPEPGAMKPRLEIREFGLAIVALDIDYIKQVLAPALFDRRFTDNGRLDYGLTIVSGNPSGQKVELEKMAYAVAARDPVRAKEEKERVALGYANSLQSSQGGDAVINMFDQGINSSEFTRGARWTMVISHRAGSLDAAVAEARRRNLITSFGILFLLAASVVIVLINARRTQQLARKQMEFVAGVSHEFRTPLAVIHALSENLADGLITDGRQVEQCGMVIRNDVRRLAGMVEQVLELAGAFSGKSLYQFQPTDLPVLIEELLSRYPMLESGKGWTVEKRIDPDLPPVMADPAALESAIRNLVDNAVKYGGAEHWLRISVSTGITEQTRRIAVTVEDRGIGIPPADVPHIFEPFYRSSEVTAAQLHGNGLGLSLVKNIVEAHGGTITVESSPGHGSAFTLNLPMTAGRAAIHTTTEGAYASSADHRG